MHANFYSGSPLDRLALRRDDAGEMDRLLGDPESLFVPVWRDQHLISGHLISGHLISGHLISGHLISGHLISGPAEGGALRVAMPSRAALGVELELLSRHPWVLLGLLGERAVVAVDLSRLDDPADVVPSGFGRFEPLRPLAPLLPAPDAAILAHARGMLHWRRRHLFCGRCGTATAPQQGGARLACPACGLEHFPRTDPVVIMLVHRQDQALLARGTRFPGTRLFSALAGFIEPGESAEEAVAREVFEETGIRVGRIRYHSSQTWPYPNSLMLGFLAETDDSALTLDPNEIAETHWLTTDELGDPGRLDIELPGSTAIAHSLIQAWRELRR